MLTLFLDVETLPGDCPAEAMTEMASRTKDAEDPERFASTSPYLCRVACICVRAVNSTTTKDAGKVVGTFPFDTPEGEGTDTWTESKVLVWFNSISSSADRIVTFAGRWFDLPVLVSRMIANGIAPNAFLRDALCEYRYRPQKHVDLVEILTGFGASKKPSLREVCLGWGLPDPKQDCDGGDVAGMLRRGEYEKVKAYCAGDVAATAAIYERLQTAGLI